MSVPDTPPWLEQIAVGQTKGIVVVTWEPALLDPEFLHFYVNFLKILHKKQLLDSDNGLSQKR